VAAFPDQLDDDWRRRTRAALLTWYRRHQRELPWRESADPYQVWISEIMLQQTTIAAVIPYYERFLGQFPDVVALASADEQQVLRAWEGLGYYSRARNLHKAAAIVANELNGQFPECADELQQLPGIGPYTARAIASLAFGRPVGILEANTLRLYARLVELDTNPRAAAGNRLLWEFADWVVSPRSPAAFNQAAMDLGSTVCLPDDPNCPRCPLVKYCGTARSGRQDEIPVQAKKTVMTNVTEVAVVIRRRSRFLMREAAAGERWAGLQDFVRFPIDAIAGDVLLRSLKAATDGQATLFSESIPAIVTHEISERTGLNASQFTLLQEIRHTVTRYRIRLLCVEAVSVNGSLRRTTGYQWVDRNAIDSLPLSTTARKIACDLIPQTGRRN